mmetsp:Transcript_14203/g.42310  ORF Transcript_14203/g.42310 Transcript_14203/m.42310 type:complete len:401 (+) Transcript_14203:1215-2417(+)
MTALTLQLGDHTLLCLVVDTATCKQTSRKVLLIEVFEDVLVLQEAEDCDHLLQTSIDLHVAGHALEALPEHVIHEQRKVLRRPRILVQEGFKRLLQRQLEVLALFEGLLHELVVLMLEAEDRRDEGHRILHLLGIRQDVFPCFADAVHHDPLHLLERLRHAAEEAVHALEVRDLVVLEHPSAPRVLHVDERLEVCEDPLLVTELLYLLHGGLVQVVLHAGLLLTNALFGLLQIVGTRVLRDVLHRLVLVELPCVVQELVLEALPVHILALDAQLHEHVDRVLQQDPVHLLAPPLRRNVLKHECEQPSANARMARHVLAEDDEAHLVDRHLLVLGHKVPVHVHQDVADHDHRCFVVVPLLLQLLQQAVVRAVCAALRHRLQVVGYDALDTIVQQLAVLVQH